MWRVRRGREIHPHVQEGLVGPTGGQEGSDGSPGGSSGVGRSSWRAGRVQESNAEVWKVHQEVQEGSGGPPSGPGGAKRGREAHPKFWKAHLEVREGLGGRVGQEGSGDLLGSPGEVGRSFHRSGRGGEAHREG